MSLLILSLAVTWDLALGEPPRLLHPVVWAGKIIGFLQARGPASGKTGQFLYGMFIVAFCALLFAVPAYFLLAFLKGFNTVIFLVVSAWLLKSSFSFRALAASAVKIRTLLEKGRIEEARYQMRSLVSRDVSNLDEPLLVAATVESVAENSSDSFVAPLFFFLLGGVPGALFYRVLNTCDAMIGYHGKFEFLGKSAARMDDVLNWVPARITALAMVAAAYLSRKNGPLAWRIMARDHSKTESPNAGWPMSAAAGGLEIQLQKVGHYTLGDNYDPPVPEKIRGSVALMGTSCSIWLFICLIVEGSRFVITS
ncbi:MAG: cobalamin biosynthesis protein [Dehalococcoidia bacterium]|nr:cobalamin biosynthesis protein [Dehalococcoidia bacterium]